MIVDITAWASPKIKAASSLKNILEEIGDEKIVSNVGKHLSTFARFSKDVQDIKNPATRKSILSIIHKNTVVSVLKKKYPEVVETHLLNVISTTYKQRNK